MLYTSQSKVGSSLVISELLTVTCLCCSGLCTFLISQGQCRVNSLQMQLSLVEAKLQTSNDDGACRSQDLMSSRQGK